MLLIVFEIVILITCFQLVFRQERANAINDMRAENPTGPYTEDMPADLEELLSRPQRKAILKKRAEAAFACATAHVEGLDTQGSLFSALREQDVSVEASVASVEKMFAKNGPTPSGP